MNSRALIAVAVLTASARPASAGEVPASTLLDAFRSFCATGEPDPARARAAAQLAGWTRPTAGAVDGADPASDRIRANGEPKLVLHAVRSVADGRQQDVCGVAVRARSPGLTGAAERWLGAPSASPNGGAVQLSVVRSGVSWSAAALPRADLARARSDGRAAEVILIEAIDNAAVTLVRSAPAPLPAPEPLAPTPPSAIERHDRRSSSAAN